MVRWEFSPRDRDGYVDVSTDAPPEIAPSFAKAANLSNADDEIARQLGRDAFERASGAVERQGGRQDRQPEASSASKRVEAAKDGAAWVGVILEDRRRRDEADRRAYRRDPAHDADYRSYLDALNTNNDHHGAFRRPNP